MASSTPAFRRSFPRANGEFTICEVVPRGAFFEIFMDGQLIGRSFDEHAAVERLNEVVRRRSLDGELLDGLEAALAPSSSDHPLERQGQRPDHLGHVEPKTGRPQRPPRRIRIDDFRLGQPTL